MLVSPMPRSPLGQSPHRCVLLHRWRLVLPRVEGQGQRADETGGPAVLTGVIGFGSPLGDS